MTEKEDQFKYVVASGGDGGVEVEVEEREQRNDVRWQEAA